MLIDIDDGYAEWVKRENSELFTPGHDEKAALQDYVNRVLAAHRKSWLADEEH